MSKRAVIMLLAVFLSAALMGVPLLYTVTTAETLATLITKDTEVVSSDDTTDITLQDMKVVTLVNNDCYVFSDIQEQTEYRVVSKYKTFDLITEYVSDNNCNSSKLVKQWVEDTICLIELFNPSQDLGLQKIMFRNGDVSTGIVKYNTTLETKVAPLMTLFQVTPVKGGYIAQYATNESMTTYNRDENREALSDLCLALNLNYDVDTLAYISGVDSDSVVDLDYQQNPSEYTDERLFEFNSQTQCITKFRFVEGNVPENIVIPPEINGTVVKAIGDSAFYDYRYVSGILSIKIPDSVESIGVQAFASNTKLKELTLPTNLKRIGEGAFQSCSSLQTLEIRGYLTEIPKHAFKSCEALKSIILTGGETFIGEGAFEDCKRLKEISNVSNVKAVEVDAFKGTKVTAEVFEEGTDISDEAFGK